MRTLKTKLESKNKQLQNHEAKLKALKLEYAQNRKAIQNDIKITKDEIVDIKAEIERVKLSDLGLLSSRAGISIDDLIQAVKSQDFLEIQEKLEQLQRNKSKSESNE